MKPENRKQPIDVAAYVWPSYTGDEIRARQFWPQGFGEWESILKMKPKFEGHLWPRKPLWGYVNEADPRVMQMQIETAVEHGLNVFIYDWYWYDRRPFLEQCLNNGFLGAKNNEKMKFYLMWANHDAGYLWDIRNSHIDPYGSENPVWLASQDRKEFEIIVHRIIEKYFSRPNYYKLDGKPVFSIFAAGNLIKGLGGLKETRKALDWFRAETVKAGFPGLHLQIIVTDDTKNAAWYAPDKDCADTIAAQGYDSATHYNIAGAFGIWDKRTVDYAEVTEQSLMRIYERFGKECSATYIPHVTLGWDDNIRFEKFKSPVYLNNTPENFERALTLAKEYLNQNPALPRLLTINSWNEWTEGSCLQPDDVYGCGYLEAIKKVFGAK